MEYLWYCDPARNMKTLINIYAKLPSHQNIVTGAVTTLIPRFGCALSKEQCVKDLLKNSMNLFFLTKFLQTFHISKITISFASSARKFYTMFYKGSHYVFMHTIYMRAFYMHAYIAFY